MTAEEQIAKLEAILHEYTTYFLAFDIAFFVLLVVGVILVTRFLLSRKKLNASNEYLLYTIHGQEEERARIARELHDTVAQDLRYCKNLLEQKTEQKNPAENLEKISDLLKKSLLQVRSMSYNLAPPDITKNDFSTLIVNLCNEFKEKGGPDFRISILDGTESDFLNEDERLNLYRIVQESFTNVLKHAQASEVVVMIRNENENEEKGLYVFISDDGKGFEREKVDSKNHFGLKGMEKRADLIGAKLAVHSSLGDGTQISIFKSNKKCAPFRP